MLLSVSVLGLVLGNPAIAQTAPPVVAPTPDPEQVSVDQSTSFSRTPKKPVTTPAGDNGTIVVTGSRIRQPEFTRS